MPDLKSLIIAKCTLMAMVLLFPVQAFGSEAGPGVRECGAADAAAPSESGVSVDGSNDGDRPDLDGGIRIQYMGRILSDGEGDDHRALQSVDLSVVESRWGHLRFSVSGDFFEDLDPGTRPEERFFSVLDTRDDVTGFLHNASLEISGLGRLDHLRLGRQFVTRELAAHLDGASLALRTPDDSMELFVYGGVPVRYFEESDYLDALQAGAGFEAALPGGLGFLCEYQLFRQEPEPDDLFDELQHRAGIRVRRSLSERLSLSAGLATLNEDLRHIDARLFFQDGSSGLQVDVTYFHQFVAIAALPSALSPLAGILGPQEPYHHAAVDVYKSFDGAGFLLAGGAEAHILSNRNDAAAFNHSYHHEYLALSLFEGPVEGLEATLHGDIWQVLDDKDDDTLILTGGGDLRYLVEERLRLGAGAFYSLFSYDYYADESEQTDTYTLYGSLRYFLRPGLYLDGRYDLNISDLYEHRIRFTVGMWF